MAFVRFGWAAWNFIGSGTGNEAKCDSKRGSKITGNYAEYFKRFC